MTRKTSISNNLTHNTKFIDPRSGKVLKEGSTPTQTVGAFKDAPQPTSKESSEVVEIQAEVTAMKNDMNEIKALLKENLKK